MSGLGPGKDRNTFCFPVQIPQVLPQPSAPVGTGRWPWPGSTSSGLPCTPAQPGAQWPQANRLTWVLQSSVLPLTSSVTSHLQSSSLCLSVSIIAGLVVLFLSSFWKTLKTLTHLESSFCSQPARTLRMKYNSPACHSRCDCSVPCRHEKAFLTFPDLSGSASPLSLYTGRSLCL